MTDFLDALKRAEALARDWLEYSEATYGRDTRDYADYVRCYFAADTRYRTVTFGRYGAQVQVQFHSPVQFGYLTYRTAEAINDILRQARELLAAERDAAAKRSEAEVQFERDARVARLKEQLAELEGGVAA